MCCLVSLSKSWQLQLSRHKKKELEQLSVKTRLAICFKYFKSQEYFAAETVQGQTAIDGAPFLHLMCSEQVVAA